MTTNHLSFPEVPLKPLTLRGFHGNSDDVLAYKWEASSEYAMQAARKLGDRFPVVVADLRMDKAARINMGRGSAWQVQVAIVKAKSLGYDGLIIDHAIVDSEETRTQYFVFDLKQITIIGAAATSAP